MMLMICTQQTTQQSDRDRLVHGYPQLYACTHAVGFGVTPDDKALPALLVPRLGVGGPDLLS